MMMMMKTNSYPRQVVPKALILTLEYEMARYELTRVRLGIFRRRTKTRVEEV